jgi:hypothetical protein
MGQDLPFCLLSADSRYAIMLVAWRLPVDGCSQNYVESATLTELDSFIATDGFVRTESKSRNAA